MKAISNRFEALLSVAVALLLLVYVFVRFVDEPYIGFHFTGTSGEVAGVFEIHPQSDALHLGDHLLIVDGYRFENYPSSLRDQLFAGIAPSEISKIAVERNGRQVELNWVLPGFNIPEFMSRFLGVWIVSFVYWAAGVATFLFVRPRTDQRKLLAAMNFVTAIWVLAGSLSRTHAWESPYVMRAALWMSAPIYLQFHWIFPHKLRALPRWFWPLIYLVAGAGALAQWLSWLPINVYTWPFSIGVLGSFVMLLFRFLFRRERRQVGLLFLAMFLTFTPALLLAFSSSFGSENIALVGFLFALPVLPGAYFYSIYRRQLAGLELRANRLISTYLFLALLVMLTLTGLPLISGSLESTEAAVGSVVLALILGVLATAFGLRGFQAFVEQRILGMPLPPEHLLGDFAGQISTSLTNEHLVAVLEQRVLPSLFIRQAALLVFAEVGKVEVVLAHGVSEDEAKDLSTQSPRLPQFTTPARQLDGHHWVRLALPLKAGDDLLGSLLLGRKDPDDYYSQPEVNTLQAIADQTAIALVNIAQARRLRALHRADIEREETERRNLARELHDEVLNRLAELGNRLQEDGYTENIEAELQALSTGIRSTVNDLRPPMLNLGLHPALMQLADDLSERPGAPQVSMSVPSTEALFAPNVEQHLFRIVQQACENAVRHAEATQLEISGELKAGEIQLFIRDDGRGFDATAGMDLLALLQARRFGLAGMYERAELIGARLLIYSSPGEGTQISVNWRAG